MRGCCELRATVLVPAYTPVSQKKENTSPPVHHIKKCHSEYTNQSRPGLEIVFKPKALLSWQLVCDCVRARTTTKAPLDVEK